MKWIKYQIVQITNGEEPILANKKVGYNSENLAIAEKEAYNGYEIIEDEMVFEKEPLDMHGLGIKNLGDATEAGDALSYGQAEKEFAGTIKSAKGTLITTDGSGNTPLAGLKLYGKTTQRTTTGKNLFDSAAVTSGYLLEDGTVATSGSGNIVSDFIPVTAGDRYCISATSSHRGKYFDAEKKPLTDVLDFNASVGIAIVPPENACYIRFTTYTKTVQVEKGSTATPYEPFTGGKASPSLEYLQELESMGESKNLVDESALFGKVGFTLEDGYYTGRIGAFYDQYNSEMMSGFEEKQQYTLQIVCRTNVTDDNVRFVVVYTDGVTNEVIIGNSTTDKLTTFVSAGNKTIEKIRVLYNRGSIMWVKNFQIEKGTVATPYKPYGKGNIVVTAAGKNLFDKTRATLNARISSQDGTLALGFSAIAVSDYINVGGIDAFYINGDVVQYQTDHVLAFFDKQKVFVGGIQNSAAYDTILTNKGYTVPDNAYYVRFNFSQTAIDNIQFEVGTTATPYEPYKGATLTAQTPNGLHSIGEVKDEIDCARGARVQRFAISKLGEMEWTMWGDAFYSTLNDKKVGTTNMLSNVYPIASGVREKTLSGNAKNGNIYISDSSYKTVDELKAALGEEAEVLYELATPIETPLTAEELAAYDALRTHAPSTTVYNDADAYMEMDYYTPTTPVQMHQGQQYAGKALVVDEHGCVVPNGDFAPYLANKFTPEWAKTHQAPNDMMLIWTNGDLTVESMQDSYVATEDANTLVNSPVISGPFYAIRKVTAIPSGEGYHITVTLYETYPVDGRIWTRMYDSNLKSWTPRWKSGIDFAPNGIVSDNIGSLSYSDWWASISEIYAAMPDNTRKIVHGIINVAGDIPTGSWSAELVRFTVGYGYVEISNDGNSTVRRAISGSWQPWEWVNPPMVLGTEYRTTERWMGNPVYVRAVQIDLSTSGYKSASLGSGVTGVKSLTSYVLSDGGYAIDPAYVELLTIQVDIGSNSLKVNSAAYTNKFLRTIVKYTK